MPILQGLNEEAHITCVRYHPNGQEFLATYSEENIYLFNENAVRNLKLIDRNCIMNKVNLLKKLK